MKALASTLLFLICLFKGNFSLLLLLLLLLQLILLLPQKLLCFVFSILINNVFFLPEAPASPKHLLIETSGGYDGGYVMVDGHSGKTEDRGGADYSGGSCGNTCPTSPPRGCFECCGGADYAGGSCYHPPSVVHSPEEYSWDSGNLI